MKKEPILGRYGFIKPTGEVVELAGSFHSMPIADGIENGLISWRFGDERTIYLRLYQKPTGAQLKAVRGFYRPIIFEYWDGVAYEFKNGCRDSTSYFAFLKVAKGIATTQK